MAICFKLFAHWLRRADSRAACTAGNNKAISKPMIGDHNQQFHERKASGSAWWPAKPLLVDLGM